jgi:MATE family multidrug resistance protein
MKKGAKRMMSKAKTAVKNRVQPANQGGRFSRLDTHDSNDVFDDEEENEPMCDDLESIDMCQEAKLFTDLAAPNVVVQVLQFTLWFTNAVVAGQWLGTVELAAVSLGNLSGNLTGLSLVFGILSALDTLVPQAMGAENYAEIGILVQRATVICFGMCIPCFAIWWQMEDILLFFDQPPLAAEYAGHFLRIYCLALPPIIVTEVCKRFLGCQVLSALIICPHQHSV